MSKALVLVVHLAICTAIRSNGPARQTRMMRYVRYLAPLALEGSLKSMHLTRHASWPPVSEHSHFIVWVLYVNVRHEFEPQVERMSPKPHEETSRAFRANHVRYFEEPNSMRSLEQ